MLEKDKSCVNIWILHVKMTVMEEVLNLHTEVVIVHLELDLHHMHS